MMRKNFAGDLLPLIFTGKARCLSGGSQPADSREPEVKTNLLMRMNFARGAKAAPGSWRGVSPVLQEANTRPLQPKEPSRRSPGLKIFFPKSGSDSLPGI